MTGCSQATVPQNEKRRAYLGVLDAALRQSRNVDPGIEKSIDNDYETEVQREPDRQVALVDQPPDRPREQRQQRRDDEALELKERRKECRHSRDGPSQPSGRIVRNKPSPRQRRGPCPVPP